MKLSWKALFVGSSLLLLLSVVSGGIHAAWSGKDLAGALSLSPVEQAAMESGLPLLDTDEVREAVSNGSRLFLDARPMSEYDQGHIPGAMSLPFQTFKQTFPELAVFLTPLDPVVVYCSGPQCDDALQVAERLREAGYQDVAIYVDGWEGWSP